jgi:nitrogenase molybdenum-iron protein alpha/beta subunit
MLLHLLKFYQGFKFYCIYGGSTKDWNIITFVKDLLNIHILHVCYEIIKDQNLPYLWSFAKDICL